LCGPDVESESIAQSKGHTPLLEMEIPVSDLFGFLRYGKAFLDLATDKQRTDGGSCQVSCQLLGTQ